MSVLHHIEEAWSGSCIVVTSPRCKSGAVAFLDRGVPKADVAMGWPPSSADLPTAWTGVAVPVCSTKASLQGPFLRP